jgi:hypothetical protein
VAHQDLKLGVIFKAVNVAAQDENVADNETTNLLPANIDPAIVCIEADIINAIALLMFPDIVCMVAVITFVIALFRFALIVGIEETIILLIPFPTAPAYPVHADAKFISVTLSFVRLPAKPFHAADMILLIDLARLAANAPALLVAVLNNEMALEILPLYPVHVEEIE